MSFGFTSYPGVLDNYVSSNIKYIYVCKVLGSGMCSMHAEVWFERLLSSFCTGMCDENRVKTSFSAAGGIPALLIWDLANQKM